jgi:glycosyltransferase involved in cell wall biosynthesis
MRVLLLASRELTGAMTGRKQVLRTIVESLHANGCEIVIAAFRADPAEHLQALKPLGVRAVYSLTRPSMLKLPLSLAWNELSGGMSANECLFYSARNLRQLQAIVAREEIDFVVCDMLRLAPYAARLGKPWHLDLDDLLSQRYAALASDKQANDQLLGFYERMLPRWVSRLATWLARKALPREARTIARREIMWSQHANSVSLVSPDEAAKFAAQLQRKVVSLPMRAQFPPADFAPPPREHSLVFLGGLDYQPNLDALRYYRNEILPQLAQLGCGAVRLHMLGKAPEAARQEFADCPQIVLHGYVDDLATELCRHALFIAPITHGTGVKTKVLDALGHGLPVVTTSKGIEGMGAQPGVHCLVGDTPAAFAAAVQELLADPQQAATFAEQGREHVRREFSLAVIAARWREILAPYTTDSKPVATNLVSTL